MFSLKLIKKFVNEFRYIQGIFKLLNNVNCEIAQFSNEF